MGFKGPMQWDLRDLCNHLRDLCNHLSMSNSHFFQGHDPGPRKIGELPRYLLRGHTVLFFGPFGKLYDICTMAMENLNPFVDVLPFNMGDFCSDFHCHVGFREG